MNPPSITLELAHLQRLQAAVETLVGRPSAEIAVGRTEVSGWSTLQHIAHVTLASELVLRNLRSLAKGSGLFVVADAEMKPEALEILERGELPRGRAQAPRMVTPPAAPDLDTVREWVSTFRADLDLLAREWPTIASSGARGFVPHQLLGPLDAAHWARFGAIHTRHHLRIAREVLSAVTGRLPAELEEPLLQPNSA